MSGCNNIVEEDPCVVKGDRQIWAWRSLCRMEKEEHVCEEGVKWWGCAQVQAGQRGFSER